MNLHASSNSALAKQKVLNISQTPHKILEGPPKVSLSWVSFLLLHGSVGKTDESIASPLSYNPVDRLVFLCGTIFSLQRSYHQPVVPSFFFFFRHEQNHCIFPAGFSSTHQQNTLFPVQWLPYHPNLQWSSYLDSLQRSCWNIAGPGKISFLTKFKSSVSAIPSACTQNKDLSWSIKYAKSFWGPFLLIVDASRFMQI